MLLEIKVQIYSHNSPLFLTNFSVGEWLCYKLTSLYSSGNESASWGKGKLYFHLFVTQVLKQFHLLNLKKIYFCILQAACQLQQHYSSIFFLLLMAFKHCQYLGWGGNEKSLDIITSLLVLSHCCFHCHCLNIKNLFWAQGRHNTKIQQIYGHQSIMFHQVLDSASNRKLSVSYLD